MTSNYNADDLLDLIADLEVLKDMAEGRGYVEPDEQIGGADICQLRTWASTARFLAGSLRVAKKLQGDLEAPTFTVPEHMGTIHKAASLALSRKAVLERIKHRTRPVRPNSPTAEFILNRIHGEVVAALTLEPVDSEAESLAIHREAMNPTPLRPEAIRAAKAIIRKRLKAAETLPEMVAIAGIIDDEIGPSLNGAQASLDRIFKMAAPAEGERSVHPHARATILDSALKKIYEEALAALGALDEV